MSIVISSDVQDDIDRATAIVKTVWLALMSSTFDGGDASNVGDTLYEALQRLARASAEMEKTNDRNIAVAIVEERLARAREVATP